MPRHLNGQPLGMELVQRDGHDLRSAIGPNQLGAAALNLLIEFQDLPLIALR